MQDPKFRHALGYAVDNDRIVKSAFQGAAEPGDDDHPDRVHQLALGAAAGDQAFTFDLEKAGELLDEAGYKKGADGKRTMPDGKPIGPLRLFARSDQKSSIDTMDFFKEWLGDLGIDSKVTAMDSSKLGDVILTGEYDAFQWDWYVEPDPDSILSDFTCDQRGGSSDSWYCDKGYDAMYKQQNTEMDNAKRDRDRQADAAEALRRTRRTSCTAYTGVGEAVRTDRFACFQPQPDPGGVWLVQYGAPQLLRGPPGRQGRRLRRGDVGGGRQRSSSASTSSGSNHGVWCGSGSPSWCWLVGGGLVFLLRRRATAAERE